MALCRFACLNTWPLCLHYSRTCSFSSSILIGLQNPLSFPNYPRRSPKFAALPLFVTRKRFTCSVVQSSSSSSSSMEAPPEGYRRNVGICLINDAKKIFAASRLDVPDAWQMPQGGIDEGEDPRAAAIRELREETGVSSAEILAEAPFWLTYDFPPDVREKLRHRWGGDWKGQAQKWFLLKFTGEDEEINLLGDGTEKPEFGNWAWLTPEQLVDLVVEKLPATPKSSCDEFLRGITSPSDLRSTQS